MATTELTDTQEAWDAIASGYDEFVTPTHFWIGDEALRRAGLAKGMRFLDVAAGSGALSIPAARLGAHVQATDLSPQMLGRLEARARKEGLAGIDVRVMDGHALEFEDHTFDVAGSQYGVMLFPDLPRAVAEMTRVVKPGGRVLLVVYGPPAQVEFLAFFIGAIQTVIPGFAGLPADLPPLPFQVANAEKLRRRLAEAGLRDIRVETVVQQTPFESGRHLWDWVVNSNPIGAGLVTGLTEAQGLAVREVLDGMLRERAGQDGAAVLTDQSHIGIGIA